jgi:hypothetical protein
LGSTGSQGAGATITNNVDNYVVTATGSGLNGEANLTFNGNKLGVAGSIMGKGTSYLLAANGAIPFDLNTGNVFVVQMNNGVSATSVSFFSRGSVTGNAETVIAVIKYLGSNAITWTGSGIYWPGGINPTLTNVNGRCDVFAFTSISFNSGWFGSIIAQNLDSTGFTI